jgi:hypothetical protein
MLPGETILSGAPDICPDCDTYCAFQILESGAGYYIGTTCKCGPYSRESIYLKSRAAAGVALKDLIINGKRSGFARPVA